jgi:hypothetical protein
MVPMNQEGAGVRPIGQLNPYQHPIIPNDTNKITLIESGHICLRQGVVGATPLIFTDNDLPVVLVFRYNPTGQLDFSNKSFACDYPYIYDEESLSLCVPTKEDFRISYEI